MNRFFLAMAACAVIAGCSSSSDKDAGQTPADSGTQTFPDATVADSGMAHPDATVDPDGGMTTPDAGTSTSALERPPGALDRPPTALPAELKPPR